MRGSGNYPRWTNFSRNKDGFIRQCHALFQSKRSRKGMFYLRQIQGSEIFQPRFCKPRHLQEHLQGLRQFITKEIKAQDKIYRGWIQAMLRMRTDKAYIGIWSGQDKNGQAQELLPGVHEGAGETPQAFGTFEKNVEDIAESTRKPNPERQGCIWRVKS